MSTETTTTTPDPRFRDRAPWQTREPIDAPSNLSPAEQQAFADGYNGALRYIGAMYVVAWTGGLDEPTFYSSCIKARAQEKFVEWTQNLAEGDRVDLIECRLNGETEVLVSCDPAAEAAAAEDEADQED